MFPKPLYYYLDGLDKKGPYTTDELLSKKIETDTLVLVEGMSKWKPLKDIPSLYEDYIDKQNKVFDPKESINGIDSKDQAPNVSDIERKKVQIPGIIFLSIGIGLSIVIAYLFVSFQAKKDYAEINERIDKVTAYKDVASDGVINGVRSIISKPVIRTLTRLDNENKPVKEHYELLSGGFQVLRMTKRNMGFDVEKITSEDMGFKVAEKSRVPGTMFTIPTYRGTIDEVYTSAFNFLTSERKDNSYAPGSYNKINTVSDISTDFHSIINTEPLNYKSGSTNYQSWVTEGSVYTPSWIVWYKLEGKHYEVILNTEYYNKQWVMFSIVFTILTCLLYLILRYSKKISFKIT